MVASKKITNDYSKKANSIIKKILLSSLLISLYFNAGLQDPFNSPKMWILMLLSAWLIPYLLPNFKVRISEIRDLLDEKISLIIVFFASSLFVSALMSDVKFTAFFGTEGRRLGFFTYLSLCLVMLGLIKFYSFSSIKIYAPVLVLSTLLAFYGFLQDSGQDFVNWNNPYNSVILTFGNPNYASAMLAILASVLVGALYDRSIKVPTKIFVAILTVFMLLVIRSSNSRQGLIAFSIAVMAQLCFILYFRRKIYGKLFIVISTVGISLIVLAMLQIGPLTDYVYKASVSIRGYYWRAAIEMFIQNPIFGVGLDRYGEYFKEYRETSYSLTYGFEITSNNAHSVPLQLLATGGVFVGFSYLVLTLYIFYAGIRVILKIDSDKRNHLIAVFSGWIAFQAQSVISIDNIGLTIWGWVFGGIIVSYYQKSLKIEEMQTSENFSNLSNSLLRQLGSYFMFLSVFIFCSFLYRGEVLALSNRTVYNPAVESNRIMIEKNGLQMIRQKFIDPNHRFWSANYLITSGYEKLGFQVLDDLIKSDPRNLNYLNAKASFMEQKKEFLKAIDIRLKIKEYDPWNARNILVLGQNYKIIENYSEMNKSLTNILDFASNDPIANEARNSLTHE
jgi:O-antigen ligase